MRPVQVSLEAGTCGHVLMVMRAHRLMPEPQLYWAGENLPVEEGLNH